MKRGGRSLDQMAHLGFLCRLLLDIEKESAGCAGALHVLLPGETEGTASGHVAASSNGRPAGVVMGEEGRVCWSSSRFYALRLRDVLASEAGIPQAKLESVFEACRKTGLPLGEALVASDLLTSKQLRDALLHQTASALAALVTLAVERGARISEFLPARAKSYQPQFTFSGCELIAEAILQTAECEREAGRPPRTYEAMSAQVGRSICFIETGSAELPAIPIAVSNAKDLSVEEAIDIFRAARSLVRPPTLCALGVEPFTTLLLEDQGCGWLAAYLSPYLCLFEVRDRSESVRLLSSLLDEKRERQRSHGLRNHGLL